MRKSFKDPKDEEDAILDAFKVFDKDNTGKIAVEELRHVFLTLGETLSKEEVRLCLLSCQIVLAGA